MADDRTDLHAEAMSTWRLSNAAFTDQRKRELEDLRFIDEDDQWPEWAKISRGGGQPIGGLPPTPPRPMITINKLIQPVDQLLAQERAAKLSLEFVPEGDADDDTAEVYEDIVRARQHESRANLARRWAFERAGKAGMGWYRIDTVYADVEDLTPETFNDQEIIWRRILNQASIYPDPYAQEPDFSDMEFIHETADLPWKVYHRRWPKASFAGDASANELTGIGDAPADWATVTDDGAHWDKIRVTAYWYFEHRKRTRVLLSDGQLAWQDELETLPENTTIVASREVDDKTVHVCFANAFEILEEQEWNGRYIPYVVVIGKEANVNGTRRWTGIVGPSKGGQHLFNFEASSLVETVNSATKAPWLVYKEHIEGFEAFWQNANWRAFPYLPVNAKDGMGNVLPFPQKNTNEPPIQAILATLHESADFIRDTTGFQSASLGDISPHDRSGKAIEALQRAGEQGSSGYLDNLATVSMPYEGKILKDLIPKIYDRPGRILPGLGADGERRKIMVNAPHVMQDGQPVPAQPGQDGVKVYDLRKGRFSVTATVGKQEATKREAASAMMGQIAQAAPQMVPAYADLWIGSMDFPGNKAIADRLHKMLPPQLLQGEDGQASPEQLSAQLQQMSQQMEQLHQAYTQAQQIIQTEQVKTQGRLQEAQATTQRDIAVAEIKAEESLAQSHLDNLTKMQVAQLNAQAGLVEAEIKAQLADQANQIKVLTSMIAADKEERLEHQGHAHEVGLAHVEHEHAKELQAMMPKPSENGSSE